MCLIYEQAGRSELCSGHVRVLVHESHSLRTWSRGLPRDSTRLGPMPKVRVRHQSWLLECKLTGRKRGSIQKHHGVCSVSFSVHRLSVLVSLYNALLCQSCKWCQQKWPGLTEKKSVHVMSVLIISVFIPPPPPPHTHSLSPLARPCEC